SGEFGSVDVRQQRGAGEGGLGQVAFSLGVCLESGGDILGDLPREGGTGDLLRGLAARLGQELEGGDRVGRSDGFEFLLGVVALGPGGQQRGRERDGLEEISTLHHRSPAPTRRPADSNTSTPGAASTRPKISRAPVDGRRAPWYWGKK